MSSQSMHYSLCSCCGGLANWILSSSTNRNRKIHKKINVFILCDQTLSQLTVVASEDEARPTISLSSDIFSTAMSTSETGGAQKHVLNRVTLVCTLFEIKARHLDLHRIMMTLLHVRYAAARDRRSKKKENKYFRCHIYNYGLDNMRVYSFVSD